MKNDPLTGLRGVVALYVMIGHYMMCMKDGRSIRPAFVMPVFYLLSGYCLTLGYGKGTLDLRAYFQNRVASIMPLYWLTNFVGIFSRMSEIPGVFLGYGVVPVTITTVLGINSWLFVYDPYFPVPFEPHTWTINTFIFFYVVFPLLLPRLKTLSDKAVSSLIIILYYVQFLPMIYICEGRGEATNGLLKMVTQSPIIRLPVFIIGMLGGIQTLRWQEDPDFQDPNEDRTLFHDIFPWGLFSFSSANDKTVDKERSRFLWKIKTDFAFFLLFFKFVHISQNFSLFNLPSPKISFYVDRYAQMSYIYIMLNLIMGLSRAPDSSIPKWILSMWPFQKVGAASFCIYMSHFHGRVLYFDYVIKSQRFSGMTEVLAFSLGMVILAYLIHTLVETPLRNLLRFKKPKQISHA